MCICNVSFELTQHGGLSKSEFQSDLACKVRLILGKICFSETSYKGCHSLQNDRLHHAIVRQTVYIIIIIIMAYCFKLHNAESVLRQNDDSLLI